jgi:hypothetical protein
MKDRPFGKRDGVPRASQFLSGRGLYYGVYIEVSNSGWHRTNAVNTRDGANAAVSTARIAMDAHPRTWIGVSVDIKNAFSSVDHKAVETALATAGGNM